MEVYNAATPGGDVLCQIKAHKSPVAVMAWNEDASLLASASQKGTVLRVHQVPQVCRSDQLPACLTQCQVVNAM